VIAHSKVEVGGPEIEAAIAVLRAGQTAVGPHIAEFERSVGKFIGLHQGVATCNGTAALHLLFETLDLEPGDEIILPASVCPGVMHSIELTGATPVFADINPDNFNLSPESVAKAITNRTRFVVVPHLFGLPSDMDSLSSLKIPLIEDCAQAFGASFNGHRVGTFGIASTYSFYATKIFSSVDGGMILSADEAVLSKARDLLYYGGKHQYAKRFNYKLTNLNAAIGLAVFSRIDTIIDERRKLFFSYQDLVEGIEWIKILNREGKTDFSVPYRCILSIEDPNLRDRFINLCEREEIILGDAIFEDLSEFAPQYARCILPNTKSLSKSCFSFPFYPGIQMDLVTRFFKKVRTKI